MRWTLDVEFDQENLEDYWINVMCLFKQKKDEINFLDHGIFVSPTSSLHAIKQAWKVRDGLKMNSALKDEISYGYHSMFLKPVEIQNITTMNLDYLSVEISEDLLITYQYYDYHESIDDFSWRDGFKKIDDLNPFRDPFHVKSTVILPWYFSDYDGGGSPFRNALHSKFGSHKATCFVDVSTVPTTFIAHKPFKDPNRNLQTIIDIESNMDDPTKDWESNWKDFREATYVFEYNSHVINYLDLTNAYTSGYFLPAKWSCNHNRF